MKKDGPDRWPPSVSSRPHASTCATGGSRRYDRQRQAHGFLGTMRDAEMREARPRRLHQKIDASSASHRKSTSGHGHLDEGVVHVGASGGGLRWRCQHGRVLRVRFQRPADRKPIPWFHFAFAWPFYDYHNKSNPSAIYEPEVHGEDKMREMGDGEEECEATDDPCPATMPIQAM